MGFYDSVTGSAAMSVFGTETVVITRAMPNTVTPGTSTITTIYSGPCDFQEDRGAQFINPAGNVDQIDAMLYIDPDSSGNLPSVQAGDTATVNQGPVFNVVLATRLNLQPIHLQIQLKRGPVNYRGHA